MSFLNAKNWELDKSRESCSSSNERNSVVGPNGLSVESFEFGDAIEFLLISLFEFVFFLQFFKFILGYYWIIIG